MTLLFRYINNGCVMFLKLEVEQASDMCQLNEMYEYEFRSLNILVCCKAKPNHTDKKTNSKGFQKVWNQKTSSGITLLLMFHIPPK